MNISRVNRRHFVQTGSLVSLSMLAGFRARSEAVPKFRVLDVRVISPQREFYCGWPTVAIRKNGELWVTWSGGREAHVCPFGQVRAMTSRDGGETWTWPRVLHDSAIDDRDSGCVETAKGSLLVSTFSSLAYEEVLVKAEMEGKWDKEKLARWKGARDRLNADERKAELGAWLLRSTDGGLSWSTRINTIVNSPHGPIQLRDGRLLYAGKRLWEKIKRIGVCESTDDGQTWQWLADIPARSGDLAQHGYHELHAVEAQDGALIVQIRNHNKANEFETLQSESRDGGKTWGEPHGIGVWGMPSHLLRLRDGRLVMSYGHRRAPFGNQARISTDNGKSWGEAMILSGDGTNRDLGYPSTVELADGTLLSVWYEGMQSEPRAVPHAVVRQARWKIEA